MANHTEEELAQIMIKFKTTREDALTAPKGVLDQKNFTEEEVENLRKDPRILAIIEKINNGTQIPIMTIQRRTIQKPKINN